jgi:hypothetical protein
MLVRRGGGVLAMSPGGYVKVRTTQWMGDEPVTKLRVGQLEEKRRSEMIEWTMCGTMPGVAM